MKKKSVFSKVLTIFIFIMVCLAITVAVALIMGSTETELFDFKNLNISNVIPVIFIGGFVCSITVGILVLFLGRDIYTEFISKKSNSDKSGGNEK